MTSCSPHRTATTAQRHLRTYDARERTVRPGEDAADDDWGTDCPLTQAEVAERLEWSISKINRIENSEVTISATDLRALIAPLGVTDQETVELLDGHSRETRAARLAVRAERRRRIFQGPDRPDFLLLLDESVVHRQIGGPAVMAEQLRSVLTMIRNNELIVRIVPMIRGAMIGQAGSFTIIDLIEDESAVLYQEMLYEDHIRDDRDTVNLYRSLFERMWEVSLTPEASTAFIEGHAATMDPSIVRHHLNT